MTRVELNHQVLEVGMEHLSILLTVPLVLDDGGLRGGVHGAKRHDLSRGHTSLHVDGEAEQGRRSKVSEK